jgi:ribonuclease HII
MKLNKVNDKLERVFLETGYDYVIGIDEVGRGSWAGPVVVGAYVFSKNSKVIPQVNDSKKLTFKQRSKLYTKLKSELYVITYSDVYEIDKYNILEATRLAINKAFHKLNLKKSVAFIDGYFKEVFDFECKTIIKGDEKHYSIAAASIMAKVYRDNLMINLSKKYPNYSFETNVGYGTKKHRDALLKYGVTDIHRRSYKPIRQLLSSYS